MENPTPPYIYVQHYWEDLDLLMGLPECIQKVQVILPGRRKGQRNVSSGQGDPAKQDGEDIHEGAVQVGGDGEAEGDAEAEDGGSGHRRSWSSFLVRSLE